MCSVAVCRTQCANCDMQQTGVASAAESEDSTQHNKRGAGGLWVELSKPYWPETSPIPSRLRGPMASWLVFQPADHTCSIRQTPTPPKGSQGLGSVAIQGEKKIRCALTSASGMVGSSLSIIRSARSIRSRSSRCRLASLRSWWHFMQ